MILREKDVVVCWWEGYSDFVNNYFVNITADFELKRESENLYDTPVVCIM